MAVSSLSDKQLALIQDRVHPEILASTCFNCNFPIDLRYGKNKYSSVGLLDLKPEQRIRKIQMIHKLFLHPVQKKLIMSIIDHFQLSAGVSTPILSTTNQPLGYVSSTWFLDLINYCQKYHIKL